MILHLLIGFVAGVAVTALAFKLKPKNALQADYEYLKRKYEEATGKTPPTP